MGFSNLPRGLFSNGGSYVVSVPFKSIRTQKFVEHHLERDTEKGRQTLIVLEQILDGVEEVKEAI